MNNGIGTLIRCANIEENRIAFYREIGLNAVQIAGVYEEHLAETEEARKKSDALIALLRKYALSVPSMFLSFPDQDWANPKTGVGLVPEKTRSLRMLMACRQMNWARRYGIRFITCHAGFASELQGKAYDLFISEMQQLVRFAASNDQEFLFETGTETASFMKRMLSDIGESNTGINFDPANLLIYNEDDPANLLALLKDRIRVMHCKDAAYPEPGKERGRETVLGQGETKFTSLLRELLQSRFTGPLIIERELPVGPEQEKDIAEAVRLIRSVRDQA